MTTAPTIDGHKLFNRRAHGSFIYADFLELYNDGIDLLRTTMQRMLGPRGGGGTIDDRPATRGTTQTKTEKKEKMVTCKR